jgi:hypothetical protein
VSAAGAKREAGRILIEVHSDARQDLY